MSRSPTAGLDGRRLAEDHLGDGPRRRLLVVRVPQVRGVDHVVALRQGGGRQGGSAVHDRRDADQASSVVEGHRPVKGTEPFVGELTSAVKLTGDVVAALRIGPSSDENVGDCWTVKVPPTNVMA